MARLFLAEEGVRLSSAESPEKVQGQGTGSLQEHFKAIVEIGGIFCKSGMSVKTRGYDETLIKDKPAEFAMPDGLVRLLIESDKSLTY